MREHTKLKRMRFKGMIIKESYQIIRDPSNILIAFVLPLILLVIYAFGISLDYKGMKIGLVVDDDSQEVTSLVSSFEYSRFFSPIIGKHIDEFTPLLTEGNIKGIVVIPSYFSDHLKNPDKIAPLQLITDGSDPNTANFVRNYTLGAFNSWRNQLALSNPSSQAQIISADSRYWFNEELESSYFLLPGSIAIIMTLIGTMLTALVVAREWERGTMEALMSTPISMGEIIMSKLIPYYFLGIGSLLFCVLFTVVIIDVPFRGSLVLLLVTSTVFLLAALGAGLLISSLSRNQFVAYQSAIVTAFLPAFMLSGFIFDINSMPLPIRLLTWLIPARYFVTILQTLFLAGNVWPILILNSIPLLLMALILFWITKKRSYKRLD